MNAMFDYIGPKGRVIGMHIFGASAPLKALQSKFGFDPASILTVAHEMLSSGTRSVER